jgi:hypothetical protein
MLAWPFEITPESIHALDSQSNNEIWFIVQSVASLFPQMMRTPNVLFNAAWSHFFRFPLMVMSYLSETGLDR